MIIYEMVKIYTSKHQKKQNVECIIFVTLENQQAKGSHTYVFNLRNKYTIFGIPGIKL